MVGFPHFNNMVFLFSSWTLLCKPVVWIWCFISKSWYSFQIFNCYLFYLPSVGAANTTPRPGREGSLLQRGSYSGLCSSHGSGSPWGKGVCPQTPHPGAPCPRGQSPPRAALSTGVCTQGPGCPAATAGRSVDGARMCRPSVHTCTRGLWGADRAGGQAGEGWALGPGLPPLACYILRIRTFWSWTGLRNLLWRCVCQHGTVGHSWHVLVWFITWIFECGWCASLGLLPRALHCQQ